MKKFLLTHLFLLPAVLLVGFRLQADQLILDRNFSPYASSSGLIFLENSVIDGQNKLKDDKHNYFVRPKTEQELANQDPFLQSRPYYQLPNSMRYGKAFLRLLELGFFWIPVNATANVAQHEVFGHGYRIRDLGKDVASVKGYLVTPIGGSTSFEPKRPLSYAENLLIGIAGVEANSILGNSLCLDWLTTNKIDGRQSSLALQSINTLPGYIMTLFGSSEDYIQTRADSGHDIAGYLLDLNKQYHKDVPIHDLEIDEQLTDLKIKGVCSVLLNPFNYFAYKSSFSYFWYNSAIEVPTFNFGSFRYLPAYQLALTPFGPENIYQNYILVDGIAPTYLYVKEGRFADHGYYGIGAENQGVYDFKYGTIGLKCDLWAQPSLNLAGESQESISSSNKPGIALSMVYRYSLVEQGAQALFCQLGFKTKGYLPGESVHAAPILKAGVKLHF